MNAYQPNVLNREDTFFGVCEALGEDLRINAFFFRIGFAGLLFWNPLAAIGAYAATGLLVGLTRWAFPNPAAARAAEAAPARTLPVAANTAEAVAVAA